MNELGQKATEEALDEIIGNLEDAIYMLRLMDLDPGILKRAEELKADLEAKEQAVATHGV